jgi:hypothetical protein
MDPATIAWNVASLLAQKFLDAAAEEAGRGAWAAVTRPLRDRFRGDTRATDSLRQLEGTLRDRFSGDPQVTDSLRQLEATPSGQGREASLANVLVARLAGDPQLADELARLIERAKAEGGVHIYLPPQPAPTSPSPLAQLSSRFVQVFEWHKIYPGEIPDFLERAGGPRVSHHDLSTEQHLIERLDTELLDFTTETFALGHNWLLQGGAANVLRSRDFYKGVERLADFLLVQSLSRGDRAKLWNPSAYIHGILYFITEQSSPLSSFRRNEPSVEDFESQKVSIGAIYKVPILEFRGREVYRYYAIRALPWYYWRSNFQLVAMMAIADACGIVVSGRYLPSSEDVADVCGGRRFPVELTDDFRAPVWRPEYPDLDTDVESEPEWYQQKWSKYLSYFHDQGYLETIREAKESRNRAWLNDI